MTDSSKVYDAIVWTNDLTSPGTRVQVRAGSSEEAQRMLKEKFGEDAVCSIWNAEDARKVR